PRGRAGRVPARRTPARTAVRVRSPSRRAVRGPDTPRGAPRRGDSGRAGSSRPLSQGADRGGEDLHVALAGAVQRELHQDLWQATALVLGGRPDVQEAALL